MSASWDAPDDDGGELTDYEVSTDDGTAWVSTGATTTSHTITGLDKGTEYDVKVRAVNSAGDGTASATVTKTTDTTVPNAPTGLGVTVGETTADLSWTAPSDNGGDTITSYEVSSDDGTAWADTGDADLTYQITGLTADTEYDFKVRAVNSEGSGTASATVTDTTDAADALTFGSESIGNQAWEVGTEETITLPEATGGTGAKTYSLSPALPSGKVFAAGTRVLDGNPTARFASDTFTYTAEDADGTTVELTFTAVVTAIAITIPNITNKTWTVGTAVSFTLPEASGGVGAFTYSLSPTLPAGVNRNVRAVTGNPTTAIVIATYTYTAEDSEGITQTRTFTIVVNAAAVPIVFGDTVDAQIWDVDVAITTLTLPTATGGDGAFTYALTPTLPMGIARLNFDVDGTPTEEFAQAFYSWVATDGNSDTKTLQFTVRVRVWLLNGTPTPIHILTMKLCHFYPVIARLLRGQLKR